MESCKSLLGALLLLVWGFFVVIVALPHDLDDLNRIQFEAAFQGECGHGSPCEQLCYELHDGMYECDCREDFNLREDGYSCEEINSTSVISSTPRQSSDEKDIFYQGDAVIDALEIVQENVTSSLSNFNEIEDSFIDSNKTSSTTTQGPNLEQKLTESWKSLDEKKTTEGISSEELCRLNCGPAGVCVKRSKNEIDSCLCPLGKKGEKCEQDVIVRSPRFFGNSWIAFPTLRGAYKHVQFALEIRPENNDGIIFLTGERDDMVGDFMALLLHKGKLEFRFDCGSGVGIVRTEESVLLNEWNHVTLFRHRWDAWLQLNGAKHAQGRSKGLFSRITFREPVFVGGPGNTTNLLNKLPTREGFKGCIRNLEINDHPYNFAQVPDGNAINGFGIEECTADKCSRVPCKHGGKCLTGRDSSATCLCPLGFSGDLCEIRVDLQVPSFNGSSHLRYKGLGEEALTWLDLEMTIKPNAPSGLFFYNGHRSDGYGDFIALYLMESYVELAFNLGNGVTVITSRYRVSLGEWHKVRISRTGRLAVLYVDSQPTVETVSKGAFTQLSLLQNMFLGGVPRVGTAVSTHLPIKSMFVGCVQSITVNGRQKNVLAEALGGADVDNCPHPCASKPCGETVDCLPDMEYFSCRCRTGDSSCVSVGNVDVGKVSGPFPPSFDGSPTSFLYFNDARTLDSLMADPLTLNVRFKTSSNDGLLLWLNNGQARTGFLSVGLENGDLVLRFVLYDKDGVNGGDGEELLVVHNATRVNDNLWHRLKAVRKGRNGVLIVDNGPSITHQAVAVWRKKNRQHVKTNFDEEINENSVLLLEEKEGLYLGGMPSSFLARTAYKSGVVGCVADVLLNADHHLGLMRKRRKTKEFDENEYNNYEELEDYSEKKRNQDDSIGGGGVGDCLDFS